MGEFYGDAYSDNTGMGQSGVSTSSGFQINNLNPALWVRNRFTTLDIGVIGQYKDVVSGSKKQTNAGGNLAYVSLAFPVSPRWVVGMSLKPYTFVDYTNQSIRDVQGTPFVGVYNTTGKGGINKASITTSYQVTKYLSLGLESSYFFGNVRKTTEVALIDYIRARDPNLDLTEEVMVSLNERTTYSDIAFRAGAALRVPIKKENKLNLNLGAAYSFGTSINADRTTTFEVSRDALPIINPDTLDNVLGGRIKTPNQFQVGASLEWPFKLILSADFNYQQWSQYRSFTNSNDGLKDVGRINIGAEYLPRFTSLNYFDLVRYRVGFSYGKTPYSIGNNDVNDTNVSLGFTFPMGRGYQNFLSVALVGGQRGNTGNGMIRERYGRVVLGVTLLERWFVKQKID
ncbi:hypothetical protein [Dyadobacter sp. CY326]|uniref:hypothetical protein n=1 Tax=Dyadobacter sp. CY326 TaxID=2907300 RepID=UPI001F1CE477|nr:hypothetical protein [Dyadobacter sp. CY326]MCE7066706.1 hypothetical protein [Dyadobacter sp. CY326]